MTGIDYEHADIVHREHFRFEERQAAALDAAISAAAKGVQLAEWILGDLKGCRAVVIGNGEMGCFSCENLTIQGAQVTMTLRSYRHRETIVPRGCKTVQYDQRLEAINGVDLVVSAMASPHCTISAAQVASLRHLPRLIIDLALPRDVNPAVIIVGNVCVLADELDWFSARPLFGLRVAARPRCGRVGMFLYRNGGK